MKVLIVLLKLNIDSFGIYILYADDTPVPCILAFNSKLLCKTLTSNTLSEYVKLLTKHSPCGDFTPLSITQIAKAKGVK